MTELVAERFSGYLRLRTFLVRGEPVEVLSGPGHDVAIVIGFRWTQDGLRFAVKTGDTRPARVLRGRPYVKDGLIGGRFDHPGQSLEALARAEASEEAGLLVVGEPRRLGGPVPTMPSWSTEADFPVLAEVTLDGLPTGDGGGLERPDLLGLRWLSAGEVLSAIRRGDLGEVARARVAYGRAFEALGLAPAAVEPPPRPPSKAGPDGAVVTPKRVVELAGRGRLLDADVRHTVGGRPDGPSFPMQIFDNLEDEIEILPLAMVEGQPWVCLSRSPSPVLEVKLAVASEVRSPDPTPSEPWAGLESRAAPGTEDLEAARLAQSHGLGPPLRLWSGEASPGQSTLVEHGYVAECEKDRPGLVPAAEALARAREEGASARTEALLLDVLSVRE